jgi:hypothetical protein
VKLTTTDQVSDCLTAYVASAALGAAIELGLFWLLTEQPLDAAGVAQALNIPIRRCQYWLQLLHSMGVIDQVPAGYAPSDLARSAILDACSQESWEVLSKVVDQSLLGGEYRWSEREHFRCWFQL